MKIAENRKNDIAVEEVTFKNDIVSIDYYLPEWSECKTLEVSAYNYENHLNDIGALEWSMQVFQGNEYVNDIGGKMTLADYFFEVDIQQKNKDAVSYLMANCVEDAAETAVRSTLEGLNGDRVLTEVAISVIMEYGELMHQRGIGKGRSEAMEVYKSLFPNPTTYPTANMNVLGSGQPASEFNVNQNK